jgi:hypothetical protein
VELPPTREGEGAGLQLTLDGRVIAACTPCPGRLFDDEASGDEDEAPYIAPAPAEMQDPLVWVVGVNAWRRGEGEAAPAADEDGEGDTCMSAADEGDVWADAAQCATAEAARRLQATTDAGEVAAAGVAEPPAADDGPETDVEMLQELEQLFEGVPPPGTAVAVAANQAQLQMEQLPVSLVPFSAVQPGAHEDTPDTGGAASSAGPAAAAAEPTPEEADVLDSYVDGDKTMEVLHLPAARFVVKEAKEGVGISERLEPREGSKYAFWIAAVLSDGPLVQSLASAADDAQRRELLDSRSRTALGGAPGSRG